MWLLVGGDSEIGAATHRHLSAHGQPALLTTRRPHLAGPHRPFLDLGQPLDRWEPPAETRAACIFVALARLADCAADPAGSAHINVTQTLALIDRLVKRGIYVLFLSSNQVFDGNAPHVPPDAPLCPVSEYGRQKAKTEAALHEHMRKGAPVGILRLAKVVSPGMSLFRGWVDALGLGQPIRAFRGMMLAPTPSNLVATAIVKILADQRHDIFQFTGPRDVSYAMVADFIAQKLGADRALVTAVDAPNVPIGGMPRHTTLDSSLVHNRYGLVAPEPFAVIEDLLRARKSNARMGFNGSSSA